MTRLGSALKAAATAAAALLLSVSLVAAGYAGTAFALAWFAPAVPALADGAAAADTRIAAYVVSNGVHTDLVLPVRTAGMDWTTVFAPADAQRAPPDAAFITLGWGDRDFYLHTPRWRDLTLARAAGALSGTGRSLLHVDWWRRQDLAAARAWHLPLTPAQYAVLSAHVLDTLAPAGGPPILVPGASYHGSDAFYEARGAYDALTTCNSWTGRGLRAAGVRVGRWTPFAANVVAHLAPVSAHTLPP